MSPSPAGYGKNPVTDTTIQVSGLTLKLGIVVQSLVNLGMPLSTIAGLVRSAEVKALHDGVGAEA